MSAHDANLLGALGLALADRLSTAPPPETRGSAAEALVALHGRRSGSSIDALARTVGLTHSGAVRLIDRLEAAGLVARRRGADQRSAAVHLTPIGGRAARRVLAGRDAAMQSVLTLLTDDQQAELAHLAAAILGQLGAAPEAERRLCRLCDLEACGRSRGDCPVAPRRGR
jgi:MarR family transcriptional regulator, negative regulator of the multidrug operon emrRAB